MSHLYNNIIHIHRKKMNEYKIKTNIHNKNMNEYNIIFNLIIEI